MDKKVERCLAEQFGIRREEIWFDLIEKGNGKLYAVGWDCEELDIKKHRFFDGLYFGKICKDGLRLSIEGSFLLGKLAKKGVVEVDENDAIRWLSGENIKRKIKGYVILKWESYFLGCGKGDGNYIKNYVPKERRLTYGDERFSKVDE